MTTTNDHPDAALSGDGIGTLLLAFRYALPRTECVGL